LSEPDATPDALAREVARRRTFAIISHPDAGKTTLTEKLLLYAGAIELAGAVRGSRNQRKAASDWMEIEQQRGISISTAALEFELEGCHVTLLDTPGHQDFSEDTYRTLLAVDSVVMVLDAAKGVEPQTLKLFEVCKAHALPVLTFVNKLDQPALDPFALLDQIEQVLEVAGVRAAIDGRGRDQDLRAFHRAQRPLGCLGELAARQRAPQVGTHVRDVDDVQVQYRTLGERQRDLLRQRQRARRAAGAPRHDHRLERDARGAGRPRRNVDAHVWPCCSAHANSRFRRLPTRHSGLHARQQEVLEQCVPSSSGRGLGGSTIADQIGDGQER